MEQDCLCPLGDPNHCSSCNELQADYDQYCLEIYQSYLWYKEQNLIKMHFGSGAARNCNLEGLGRTFHSKYFKREI